MYQIHCDSISPPQKKNTKIGINYSTYRYKKEIPESECAVVSPMELGGFKSEGYLAINPQGKVPSLKVQATGQSIAESDTVCRYLLSTYSHLGPSFQPDNPLSNEIARFHDMYLTTIQACLYKAGPPFGTFGTRKDALQEYSRQLYLVSKLMDDTGPYMCGNEVSLADATVFPSIVFATVMFPKFEFGAERQPIPKNIEDWFQRMIDSDSAFQKVYNEVSGNNATRFCNASKQCDREILHCAVLCCTSLETIF